MQRLLITAATCLLTCASVYSADWPHWRGPASIGVSPEKNLPVRWSTTDNVAWRAPLKGVGVSSPIVFGDRVFVTSQVGSGVRRPGSHPSLVQGPDAATAGERNLAGPAGQGRSNAVTFVLEAYRASDGRRLWEFALPSDGELQQVHDKHNLATASATADAQVVVAWFGTGQVAALDHNGTMLWKRNLGKEYPRS